MKLIEKELALAVIRDEGYNDGYIENMVDAVEEIDVIPISFIDRQIERYQRLFEENLYANDVYERDYRMIVDALNLLKKRWRHYESNS